MHPYIQYDKKCRKTLRMVFKRMKLCEITWGRPNAVAMVTYDLSCAEDKTHGCPHGNVHNVHKQPVGSRIAALIRSA